MAAVGMVIGVGLAGAAVVFDAAGGKGLVKIEEVLDRSPTQARLTDLPQTTEG